LFLFPGKYPHLLVSCSGKKSKDLTADDTEAVVNFGKVVIGKTVEKWVDIHNLSPVSNIAFTVSIQNSNCCDSCLMILVS
jgi:hypothetical protein